MMHMADAAGAQSKGTAGHGSSRIAAHLRCLPARSLHDAAAAAGTFPVFYERLGE